MRRFPLVLTLASAGLVAHGATRQVMADASLVAVGSVSTGYSNNILGVAPPVDPLQPSPQADAFMDLSPGLSAAYEMRRAIHNLNYIFGARLMFENSEGNSFNNTLQYVGLISLSPRSSLRLGAGLNSGRINGFDQNNANVVGEGDLLPRGDVEFVAFDTNAEYRRLLTQTLTLSVGVGTTDFRPTGGQIEDAARTRNLQQTLRLEKRFLYHLVGLENRLVYNRQTIGGVSERSMIVGPGLLWVWNLSERWSTAAGAGIDIVGEYPRFGRGLVVPRYNASLNFTHERGAASVGWTRGTQLNLFGGNTTVNTTYFANVGLPLPTRRPMAIAFAAAYTKGEVVDLELDGATRGEIERISADASYSLELQRGWNLAFRVERSRQDIDNGLMGGINQRIDVTQGTVTITGRFPTVEAAQVPRQNNNRADTGNAQIEGPTGGAPGPGSTGGQSGRN